MFAAVPGVSLRTAIRAPVTCDVGMRATSTGETSLVTAAQAGDRRALDDLVTAYLPLVYTVVRRALGDRPDVDDVVQETMLRALRELGTLRAPESFRPWLLAIAIRQVSTHRYRRDLAADRTTALDEVVDVPHADVEDLAMLRLELSSQRRQVVRAGQWLDPGDRALLSLWWLEVADLLTRTELAAALGIGVAHAGVRVQRMRNQLELSRSLVAALEARPRCPRLATALAGWDGAPSPLWRKRLARHTRSCPTCTRAASGLVPPERLLVGAALLSVPVALSAAVLGKCALATAATSAATGAASVVALSGAGGSGASVAALSGAGGSGAVAGVKAGLLSQLAQVVGAHPVAAAVAAGTLVAGAAVTTATWPTAPPAPGVIAAPSSSAATSPSPSRSSPASALAPPRSAPAEAVPPPRRRPSPAVPQPSSTGPPSLAPGPASLESTNEVGLVVTTAGDLGVLERVDAGSDEPARQRATFEVVPGLADPACVSFRAQDGRYLRHSSWRLRLSQDEGTRLFRGDATFCVRAGSAPGSVSLESANYPGAFLRHRGLDLWVDFSDGGAAFRADASFLPRPPLAG